MVRTKEGHLMTHRLFLSSLVLLLSGCTIPSLSVTGTSSTALSETPTSTTSQSSVAISSEETFDYGEDFIASHLGTTYWITYSYSAKTNGVAEEPYLLTSARNEQGYYIKDNAGTEALFIKDGADFIVYMPNDSGVLSLVPDLRLDETNVRGYTTSLLAFMSIYDVARDDLVKNGEEVIAGRSCWKYIFHATYTTSAIDLHYSIDKKTGVCLRYNAEAIQGKDTSAFEFVCTVFKDSNVTLPSHQ